jgi:hypothetical protein
VLSDQPNTTEAVITEKMWFAGLAEARRAGMGPAFTYCDYRELKTWLSAAYRAMRLAECADEK